MYTESYTLKEWVLLYCKSYFKEKEKRIHYYTFHQSDNVFTCIHHSTFQMRKVEGGKGNYLLNITMKTVVTQRPQKVPKHSLNTTDLN